MYAVYEKVNYRTDKTLLDEITGDLELFHKINNATNECLGRYVLGFESYLKLENEYKINHDEVQSKLIKHRRLTEWDSLYLIVLFITHVSLNKALSNREKLRTVVEWLITDFRLSLVAITYVSVYFGKMPLKNMMKFKESQSPEYKLNNLFNMTWDLYNLNRFFRMWTNRDPTKEEMFASGDKAFNAILRNSINVQNKGDLSAFEIFLPQDEVNYLEKITANPNLYFERAYNSDQWTIDYRTTLINKYESTLGVSSSET